MVNDDTVKRYTDIDLPFYKEHVAPVLPPAVLDFHTHVWIPDVLKESLADSEKTGAKYLVTEQNYPIERLLQDGNMLFPDRTFEAVCFGNPTPNAKLDVSNAYTAKAGSRKGLYPLILTGSGLHTHDELTDIFKNGKFWGYKVFLNWLGNNYGKMTIEDMLSDVEMGVADDLRLVVLLHVPRAERLADKDVQRGVERLSKSYPKANIVLAHCGRCYLPDEMQKSIGAIRNLENVYLDTSMVMDATVLEIILDNIDSKRVLFATDLPVAVMRGRRVYVMDHWVDVVLEGYQVSDYRVASNNIRATFMAYEIILAIKTAARRIGLSEEKLKAIFYENGKALLDKVKRS